MRPSERASGNPPVAVLLFAAPPPPPPAAFNKDPDQQEEAESCGRASHSQTLCMTGARLAYCFNAVPQNSGGAVSSTGCGSNRRAETGQHRLAGQGPTSEAVTVKCFGMERRNGKSSRRNEATDLL